MKILDHKWAPFALVLIFIAIAVLGKVLVAISGG